MTKTSNEAPKSNPYITKSISKTLLTPCRRVGLPRKKQTPNNSTTPNNSESVGKVLSSSNSETTPSNVSYVEDKQKESGSSQVSGVKDKKKSKVSKRLIIDDEVITAQSNNEETNFDNSLKVCDEVDSDEELLVNKRKYKVIESDSDNEEKHVESTKNNKQIDKKKPKKVHRGSDSDEDFKITKHNTKEKSLNVNNQKVINNNNKQKSEEDNKLKNNSLEDVTNIDYNKKKEDQVKISSSSSSKYITVIIPSSTSKNVTDISQKTKKLKRSLSMKKSSEDEPKKPIKSDQLILKECSISLSPIRTELQPKLSLIDVQNLEKVLTEKKKLVSDLKQAEIYQKKHNIQELQKLTELWKSGCTAALKDLLPHLQSHASIDMTTLLKNLRIPENLISLTESGELI